MNPYEEYVKQLQIEDVKKFFGVLNIYPSSDLCMRESDKERVLRKIERAKISIRRDEDEIKEIQSRVNTGPAPRKSKYDPDNIRYCTDRISRIVSETEWIKTHVRNLGWDITDKELEV